MLLFRPWAGGDFGTRIGLFTAQANGRVGHSSEGAAFGVGSPGGDEAKLNRVFLIAWGLGWLAGIQSLALGLVARHWHPFDTPAAVKRLRWLCGVATVIGALLLLPSAAIAVPSLPIGFRVGSVMVSVVVAPAICLWVAGFPRKRLVPAQLRFAVRRTVAPNSQPPGKIQEPGVLLVTTQPWPQRLWSIPTSLWEPRSCRLMPCSCLPLSCSRTSSIRSLYFPKRRQPSETTRCSSLESLPGHRRRGLLHPSSSMRPSARGRSAARSQVISDCLGIPCSCHW